MRKKLLSVLAVSLLSSRADARGAARGSGLGSGCMDVTIDDTGTAFSVVFLMKPPTLTSQGWTCPRVLLPDVSNLTLEVSNESLEPISVHVIPRLWQNAYGAQWETTDTVAAFDRDKVRRAQGIVIAANGGAYSVKFKAAEVARSAVKPVR